MVPQLLQVHLVVELEQQIQEQVGVGVIQV
jgi:hypothetical protein